MAKHVDCTDSLGRMWRVTRDADGFAALLPIGHDTNPDSPALSVEDERMLLDKLPDEDEELGEEDYRSVLYDRRRDILEDLRVGAY